MGTSPKRRGGKRYRQRKLVKYIRRGLCLYAVRARKQLINQQKCVQGWLSVSKLMKTIWDAPCFATFFFQGYPRFLFELSLELKKSSSASCVCFAKVLHEALWPLWPLWPYLHMSHLGLKWRLVLPPHQTMLNIFQNTTHWCWDDGISCRLANPMPPTNKVCSTYIVIQRRSTSAAGKWCANDANNGNPKGVSDGRGQKHSILQLYFVLCEGTMSVRLQF